MKALIAKADVVIQNFRPGVIERLGLDYASAKAINRGIVYASITGYGEDGPWAMLPGQDLLAQARAGIMWLNGDHDQGPVPFGLAIADLLAGSAIVQGVLAALLRRGRTGEGAHIETSLLEALVDFQFEVLTTYMNDGGRAPARSQFRNAHAYLAAPYGVYQTRDGWLAIAMTPLDRLAKVIDLPAIAGLPPSAAFERRDELKRAIAGHLAGETTAYWLARMQPADIWCAEVLDWAALFASDAFRRMDMLQTLIGADGPRGPHHPLADPRRRRARTLPLRRSPHWRAHRSAAGGNGALTRFRGSLSRPADYRCNLPAPDLSQNGAPGFDPRQCAATGGSYCSLNFCGPGGVASCQAISSSSAPRLTSTRFSSSICCTTR